MKRFTSRFEAAKCVGLAYISAEVVFFILATLSPLVIRWRIIRISQGVAVPKFHPIWKDGYKLGLFCVVGLLIPTALTLNMINAKGNSILLFLGFYIIILTFQHNVNVVLFDHFRGNRLPLPKAHGRLWHMMDRWSSKLLPLDPHATDMASYALTSGQRRIVIAVMDFWLMLVGFALIYITWIPSEFKEPLNKFTSALYFSVITGFTVGFGDNHPMTEFSRVLVVFQSMCCFSFALIIVAHLVSLIPKARQMEE